MRDGRQVTVEVTADGAGLVSRAGTALLARVADKVGLTRALSLRLAALKRRRRGHDPGRVIRDLAVMLADGGESVSDLGAVRTRRRRARPAPTRAAYGFHPLLGYADETREALGGLLRPGNAGANTASDHVAVLDLALAQIPAEHIESIEILVRADTAGATHDLLDYCREANLRFSVGYELTEQVRAAI